MKRYPFTRAILFAGSFVCLLLLQQKSYAQHPFVAPTPEELNMKSIPEVPGASAVILDYEETDDDMFNHSRSFYFRIKILTEAGKDLANISLQYDKDLDDKVIDDLNYLYSNYSAIAARTIEPDGTIVPFTGKPYEKTIEQATYSVDTYKKDVPTTAYGKTVAKVFTLPDVRVGSILEYRYTYNYDHHIVMAPSWIIQRNLFIKHAKFTFDAINKEVGLRGDGGGQLVEWVPHIPKDWTIKHLSAIDEGATSSGHGNIYTLEVNDVPPVPVEPYLPPIGTMTYRVDFFYFDYKNFTAYWAGEGKYNSAEWDRFMGSGGALRGMMNGGAQIKAATADIVAGATTDEAKLRKIYAAIQAMDNTNYTRQHSQAEDKAQGLHNVETAADVLSRKRGNRQDLTLTFVAMARAAGLKAYVMAITPRTSVIFDRSIANWYQMYHIVAIVNLGGTEQFFDPGVKYCKFGQLSWEDTEASGVRQVEGGTQIAQTPFMNFKQSTIQRAAALALDDHGIATGQLQEVYDGIPALQWRIMLAESDETTLRTNLVNDVKDRLPGGMEISLASIQNVTDPDQPLAVNFNVKGAIGTVTGKRFLVPGDIFQTNTKPLLTESKRETAVYLKFNAATVEMEQIKLPPSMTIDSVPDKQDLKYKNQVAYNYSVTPSPNSVLVKRVYVLGQYVFPPAEYSDVRDFYNKVAQADQSVILVKQVGNNGN